MDNDKVGSTKDEQQIIGVIGIIHFIHSYISIKLFVNKVCVFFLFFSSFVFDDDKRSEKMLFLLLLLNNFDESKKKVKPSSRWILLREKNENFFLPFCVSLLFSMVHRVYTFLQLKCSIKCYQCVIIVIGPCSLRNSL